MVMLDDQDDKGDNASDEDIFDDEDITSNLFIKIMMLMVGNNGGGAGVKIMM